MNMYCKDNAASLGVKIKINRVSIYVHCHPPTLFALLVHFLLSHQPCPNSRLCVVRRVRHILIALCVVVLVYRPLHLSRPPLRPNLWRPEGLTPPFVRGYPVLCQSLWGNATNACHVADSSVGGGEEQRERSQLSNT